MADSPERILALDESAERSLSALRLFAAVVCLCGAAVLALSDPPPLVWVCAGAGALGALAWIAMVARSRRRLASSARYFLALEPGRLRLVEGAEERSARWEEIAAVEADEDRLVVRISLGQGGEIPIEPRYGGLGMYELEDAVRGAWRAGIGGPP